MNHFRLIVTFAAMLLSGVVCAATASTTTATVPSRTVRSKELSTIFATKAVRPPLTHPSGFARRIEPLLVQQGRYLLGTMRPWDGSTSGAMLLTDGSSNEHGIRPNSHTALALAIIATCVADQNSPENQAISPAFAQQSRDGALALLRFLLPTHGAGAQLCSNGKPWKDQWQSALWANDAGKAAWLLWDDLTPYERWLAARMIQDEANRFVDATPPSQILKDTKSEENAWNSTILTLACNMFPQHPQASRWRTAAIRWILNSYGREKDLNSDEVYDERPLSEWLDGAVLHDDYTLENHNRVHPDYMGVTRATLMQTMVYDWGQTAVPEALRFNVREVQNILEELSWPDGGVFYPNGQDWQIHRSALSLPLHALHAVLFSNKRSAALMRMALETAEAMAARDRKGGLYLPDEYFFPSTQHYVLQMLAESWLVFRQYGEGPTPPSPEELFEALSGTYHYPSGGFAVLRTLRSVASFSWGHQVMGQVLPLEKDLLVTPNERGLIGTVRQPGQQDVPPRVVQTEVMPTSDTLQVAGVLERAGGKVEQRYAFVVLLDGRSVYVDQLISREDTPLELHLGTVGVLNEPRWAYSDGDRTISTENARHTFRADASDTTVPVTLDSPWVNVDDRLGVVRLAGTGKPVYIPTTEWKTGRVEQLLHLNYLPTARAETGKELTRSALVFYPNRKAADMAAITKRCRLESGDGSMVTVVMDDGTRVSCDLGQLRTTITGP